MASNDDLKSYLENLDKILDTFKSFYNVSEVLKNSIKGFKTKILVFEKLDYEVDKELLNFVTDCQKEKYLNKLKVVQDALIQIEEYEKQLDGDDLNSASSKFQHDEDIN